MKAWKPRPPTQGTPADLVKPLYAFANRPGGRILLFGLDEDAGFKVVGVGNPRKLQEDLSGLVAQMEPPLRPSFSVEEIEGENLVAVEVPEVAFDQKPCYHRPHGLHEGSFIRVGNFHPADDGAVFEYMRNHLPWRRELDAA